MTIKFCKLGNMPRQRRMGTVHSGIQVSDPNACPGETPLPASLDIESLQTPGLLECGIDAAVLI